MSLRAKSTSLILFLFILTTNGYSFDDNISPWLLPDGIEKDKPIVKEVGELKKPTGGMLLNGDCSDAVDLSALVLPIEFAGSTVGATNDYGPFGERPTYWLGSWDGQSAGGPDVAYKWTAPANGTYTISLCETDYDNCLEIYRYTCPDEPTVDGDFVIGGDDNCEAGAKLRNINFTEGEEILIVVDGYGNNSGNFVLRIYETLIDYMDWFIETQMNIFHIPGTAACIVKNGQVDWTGVYGYANIEDSLHVADTSLFMLASISKSVVSIALMQLWEDSLFQLDDDVNDYLPFSVRNPDYATTPITFRMLTSHVSSINDNWTTLNSLRTWGADSPIPLGFFLEEYLTTTGIYYNSSNYNSWEPGTTVDYSNIGAALAAYLVETLNPDSLSFDQYCENHIFDPLGMDETAWLLSQVDTNNVIMPYQWNGNGYTPWGHYCDPWYPSASLRTSVHQLATHLITFMQGGQFDTVTILQSATVDTMMTVQYPGISSYGIIWYPTYFGFRQVWGHGGNYFGVETRMFFFPEENTGVIVLTNGELAYAANALVNHLFEYAAGPFGYIAGVITDQSGSPVDRVYAKIIDVSRMDYSDENGEYYVGGMITDNWYDLRFRHPAYVETTVVDIPVTNGDTTFINIALRTICDYTVGDANNSGSYDGLDITYGVAFLKGGPAPVYECECGQTGSWYVAGDVNGSCSYNGLDITYGVSYFKGGLDPVPCASCPPN